MDIDPTTATNSSTFEPAMQKVKKPEFSMGGMPPQTIGGGMQMSTQMSGGMFQSTPPVGPMFSSGVPTVAPSCAEGSIETSSKRTMTGKQSQKKKTRPDAMDVEEHKVQQEPRTPREKPTTSFNLKTLNTSANYKQEIEAFMKSYFNMISNLIERSSDKVTDFYFNESMFTATSEKGEVVEIKGEKSIYEFFTKRCHMRKYNISSFHIQPGLGQGAFVRAKGTMGTIFNPVLHKISMSFVIVRLRKKFYILNQAVDIE
tara:strand:- start:39 stop:812 length:774 start_codon:yes stop_codon:yes gene_type:complete